MFVYLDFKSRLHCKRVCQYWNILIGQAKEFKAERNLTLNQSFNTSVINDSETAYHSVSVHDYDAKQDMTTVWIKLGETIEKLDIHTTNESIIKEIIKHSQNLSHVKHLILRRGYHGFKFTDWHAFAKLEVMDIKALQFDDDLEKIAAFYQKLPNLHTLRLEIDRIHNAEHLFKSACQHIPKLKDLQIYSIDWATGINFQTIMTETPKRMRHLNLCNMVKYGEIGNLTAGLLAMFEKYHDLQYLRVNHIKATYVPQNDQITVERIVPVHSKEVYAFKRSGANQNN